MRRNALLAVLSVALLAGGATLSLAKKHDESSQAAPPQIVPSSPPHIELLPSHPQQHEQEPAFVVRNDIEFFGTDLRPGFRVSGLDQCMQACSAAHRCRAFILAPGQEEAHERREGKHEDDRHEGKREKHEKHEKDRNPTCWLKADVSKKMHSPGMISGIKQHFSPKR